MFTVAEFIKKFNSRREFKGSLRFDEPMSAHTTFRAGGPADLWIRPADGFPEYAAALVREARAAGIPVFILGGGANLVVADEGIRGIVLDTGGHSGVEAEAARTDGETALFFRSGTPVDEAVEYAAAHGLSGLEFLAGMPGSVGGALWMNARCYEQSVSDVLVEAEVIDLGGGPGGEGGGAGTGRRRIPRREEEFGYKTSPFQSMDALITGGVFALKRRPENEIRRIIEERRRDREEKGHYRYPSAGSVFKNSRALGKPTGAIIDALGLRGLSVGDAQVAPWHGNIIINRGNAAGSQIRELIRIVHERVRAAAGIELECEVLFAGFSGAVD